MWKLLLLLLLIFSIQLSFAKDKPSIGYAISLAGDTAPFLFAAPLIYKQFLKRYDLSFRVEYLDDRGKKQKLDGAKYREVFICGPMDSIRLFVKPNNVRLSEPNRGMGKYLFLEHLVKGKLNAYVVYVTHINDPKKEYIQTKEEYFKISTSKDLAFEKPGQGLLIPLKMGRKRDLTEYFSDCPALLKLYETENIAKASLEDLANQYNSLCGQ